MTFNKLNVVKYFKQLKYLREMQECVFTTGLEITLLKSF